MYCQNRTGPEVKFIFRQDGLCVGEGVGGARRYKERHIIN